MQDKRQIVKQDEGVERTGPRAEVHSINCPRPGFRYGATQRDGKVVMFCKTGACSARRIV